MEQIRGKHFLAVLTFVFDVLEHLSFWSKKMQERSGLLADFVDFKDRLIETFENLKSKNGKAVTLLLENSECEAGPCDSIEDYY